MKAAIQEHIPGEIIDAFHPSGIEEFTRLSGGKINDTFRVRDKSEEDSILQRLHPATASLLPSDYRIVSTHLAVTGWEVAAQRETTDGRIHMPDDSERIWRSFDFIDSDNTSHKPLTLESTVALSSLLGRLHNSLSDLDHRPTQKIPHFHDTSYYIDLLAEIEGELPTKQVRALARSMVDLSLKLELPEASPQIIHGDPKLDNTLYRKGRPFTFIDFDTIMEANPMIDVGDMIRSISGKLVLDESAPRLDIEPIAEAYRQEAQPSQSTDRFTVEALEAGKLITLELGMRYLIDAVQDNYFSWDPTTFPTRAAHNISRAEAAWNTFNFLRS